MTPLMTKLISGGWCCSMSAEFIVIIELSVYVAKVSSSMCQTYLKYSIFGEFLDLTLIF